MTYTYNGVGVLKRVLLTPPTHAFHPAPIDEISKIWADSVLDIEKMKVEHQTLVKAYQDNGVAVELFNAPKELNEAIYARDFGGCVREGYVLGNFKEDVRKHEHEAYEARMAELGITKLGEVTEGVFEGGDFQWLDDHTLAVGMIARTNQKGIDELQAILAPLGYTVIGVPCNPDYLHLDMLFNLIDEKTAIGFRDGLPHEFLEELHNRGIELISAGEEAIFHHYYNVQAIGNKRVISLKQNTFLNHEMQRRGFEVIEVDITEILKDGGGIHCMTFPLKREK